MLPIFQEDERMSSAAVGKKKIVRRDDALAAAEFLQSFIDRYEHTRASV